MLIRLSAESDLQNIQAAMKTLGLWTSTYKFEKDGQKILAVKKHSNAISPDVIEKIPGVLEVIQPKSPHPLVDQLANKPLIIESINLQIGGSSPPVLMSGPCSIESEVDVHQAASMVASSGGRLLRGGAYKPRTSPYSFCGHGAVALSWIREAANAHSLGVITEALSIENVKDVAEVADIIQVGARNMQNYPLLKEIGITGKPALLKRSMSATVEEWLLAGEHLLAAGSCFVLFCSRGIRGYDPHTRNLLDIGAAALLKHVHGLTVIVDPSHAVGRRDLIYPLSKASLAMGIDGLLVEAHHNSGYAKSDGPQALNTIELKQLGQLVDSFNHNQKPTAKST